LGNKRLSLGLFNDRIGFYGIFSSSLEGGFPPPGRVGIASQSGAYGSHLFTLAGHIGLGTPLCVTTGNEADVTVGEVAGWMVEDPNTDVIALYAEGIREASSFVAALTAARKAHKPVVIMKVGRSALGQHSARTHTASIAGDDAVTDAVLKELGAVRARTTEELLDIVQLATRRIYPAANTLGVITVSGGAGVLVSDTAEELGLPMPSMPQDSQARLSALLPISAPHNPVDCTAQAFNDMSLIGSFTEEMVAGGGYHSVLGFFTQVGGAASLAPRLREQLSAVRARHPDRLYVLSVIAPPELIANYEADGFTVFEDPTRATVAIHAMGQFGAAFAEEERAAPPIVPMTALPQKSPNEAAAKALLAAAGITAVPEQACATAGEAVIAAEGLGFPVVMKVLSPDILHKSDIGGVLLDITTPDAVRTGFDTLLFRAKAAVPLAQVDGVLVAKQLRGGVECIMGIHRDPVFGAVAMFGLGGVFVEIMRDVALRRCPFGTDAAEAMIRSIRAAPLLLGARGRPAADVPALSNMLARLSVFAHDAGPRLISIDLNPVLAMPAGQGAFAVDAVMELQE
jgi:acyl-CoA synthetase (NDP forming)